MKLFIFVITVLSFSCSFADSENCPSFDLQGKAPSLPYFDQGSTRFCYAYAASYMTNFYYHAQLNQEDWVNPLSVSAQAIRLSKGQQAPSNIWGGHLSHGLMAIEQGVCSVQNGNLGVGNADVDVFVEKLREIYVEAKSVESDEAFNSIESFFEEIGVEVSRLPSPEKLKVLASQTSTDFVADILEGLCEKQIFPPLPPERKVSKRDLGNTFPNFETLVTRELSMDNPLGLHFCSDVILDPDFEFTSYNQICSEHYAVITGQRTTESGQCEIQLQDSQCQFYNGLQPARCQDGEVWVRRELVLKTLKNLHWLDLSL